MKKKVIAMSSAATPAVSSWWYVYECNSPACSAPGTMLDLSLPAPERDVGPPVACPICAAPMEFRGSWPADSAGYGSRSNTGWTNRVPTPEEAIAEAEYGGRWAWRENEESPWFLLDALWTRDPPRVGQFRLYDRDGYPTMWRGSPRVDLSYPMYRFYVVGAASADQERLYDVADNKNVSLHDAADRALDTAKARAGDEIEIIVHRTGRRREEL